MVPIFKILGDMAQKHLLLLSTSVIHGTNYLDYAASEIKSLLNGNKVSRVLFIPYALNDHDKYTEKVRGVLSQWGYKVDGIHESKDPQEAVKNAEAIFIGGGNTFRLLKSLYDFGVLEPIRARVLKDGIPYIGSSAGTNVATANICTTNDMPIVYPPSFKALGLVPFNINPHYVDPDPTSTHMGETREVRISQYHEVPESLTVLGLREGSYVSVEGSTATLKGHFPARLFLKDKKPEEISVGSDLSFLLDS